MLSERGLTVTESLTQAAGLFGLDENLKGILRELRERLEVLYGDRLVQTILFGSQARGDAQADSDMDVLLVLKGPLRVGQEITRMGPLLTALSLEHDTLVSCAFVTEERFREEQSPFLMNVRREGIAL
jgi:predicted nucleotidyltransferase